MTADRDRVDDIVKGLKAGSLEVYLARDAADVDAAQALRYRIFYEEMAAEPDAEMSARRRDFDDFDGVCDHLLVVDNERGAGGDAVVGTYRLLRRSVAEPFGRFYTADEYDIAKLAAVPGEILELGRSCVDADYRNRATIQLLLRGIAAYVQRYHINLMFGCASLPGVDPQELALPLAYLHHYHLAVADLRPRAQPACYLDMDLMAAEAIDKRAALAALPPLVRGYLRAGCSIGDGAVIDYQFHTIDVCVMLLTDRVNERYRHRYEGGTGDLSAR